MKTCNYCAEEIKPDSLVCPHCDEKNPFGAPRKTFPSQNTNTIEPNYADMLPFGKSIWLFKTVFVFLMVLMLAVIVGNIGYVLYGKATGSSLEGQLENLTEALGQESSNPDNLKAKFLPNLGDYQTTVGNYRSSLLAGTNDPELKDIVGLLYDPEIKTLTEKGSTNQDSLVNNLLRLRFILRSKEKKWRINYGYLSPKDVDFPLYPSAEVKLSKVVFHWIKLASGWKLCDYSTADHKFDPRFAESEFPFSRFDDLPKNLPIQTDFLNKSDSIASFKTSMREARSIITKHSLEILKKALAKYHKKKKKWPTALTELIPKYIDKIPFETLTNSDKVVPAMDGNGGWVFNIASGEITPNTPLYNGQVAEPNGTKQVSKFKSVNSKEVVSSPSEPPLLDEEKNNNTEGEGSVEKDVSPQDDDTRNAELPPQTEAEHPAVNNAPNAETTDNMIIPPTPVDTKPSSDTGLPNTEPVPTPTVIPPTPVDTKSSADTGLPNTEPVPTSTDISLPQ